MNDDLEKLVSAARSEFAAAATPAELENAKARFLGKSGRITELLKSLATLSVEEKKARGALINAAKQQIEAALTQAREALAQAELDAQLKAEALDVTLPGRQRGGGGVHPVARTMERIEAIFGSMGFDVADGPDVVARAGEALEGLVGAIRSPGALDPCSNHSNPTEASDSQAAT